MKTIAQYTKVIALIPALLAATFCLPSAFANPQFLDFITMSDIHLNNFGKKMVISPSIHNDGADLDKATFKKLLSDPAIGIAHEIETNIPQAKFIIILGDIAGHTAHISNRTAYLKNALTQLKTDLRLPIINIMGNNDSLARNYGLFTTENIKIATDSGWRDVFLSTGVMCFNEYPCLYQVNKVKGEGYFAAYLQADLKFIGMNSLFFQAGKGVPEITPKEMQWLGEQLKDSAHKNEAVLIGMHIPPAEWGKNQLEKFGKEIKAYPGTVIGIFAGHAHVERLNAMVFQYKNLQGNLQNYLIPIIHTAGLSTIDGNAPSFKNFKLIKKDVLSKWAIKDYTTYSFQQKRLSDPVTLINYYSFNSVYCPDRPDATVVECMEDPTNIPNFYKIPSKLAFSNSFNSKVKKHLKAGNPNMSGARGAKIIVIK